MYVCIIAQDIYNKHKLCESSRFVQKDESLYSKLTASMKFPRDESHEPQHQSKISLDSRGSGVQVFRGIANEKKWKKKQYRPRWRIHPSSSRQTSLAGGSASRPPPASLRLDYIQVDILTCLLAIFQPSSSNLKLYRWIPITDFAIVVVQFEAERERASSRLKCKALMNRLTERKFEFENKSFSAPHRMRRNIAYKLCFT